MIAAFWSLFCRDCRLALRQRGEWANTLFFFLMVVTIFPMAIGPSKQLLASIAPGVVWMAALLATLLVAERLFRQDYDDGSLEQLLLSGQPLWVLVMAKVSVHWLLSGLPLALLAVPLASILSLPDSASSALFWSLVLGTPVLSWISAIGAALTVSLRRGGFLVALISLPLYVPVLIFGTGAVQAAAQELPYTGQLALVAAMLALSCALAPLAVAAALRVSTDV